MADERIGRARQTTTAAVAQQGEEAQRRAAPNSTHTHRRTQRRTANRRQRGRVQQQRLTAIDRPATKKFEISRPAWRHQRPSTSNYSPSAIITTIEGLTIKPYMNITMISSLCKLWLQATFASPATQPQSRTQNQARKVEHSTIYVRSVTCLVDNRVQAADRGLHRAQTATLAAPLGFVLLSSDDFPRSFGRAHLDQRVLSCPRILLAPRRVLVDQVRV